VGNAVLGMASINTEKRVKRMVKEEPNEMIGEGGKDITARKERSCYKSRGKTERTAGIRARGVREILES